MQKLVAFAGRKGAGKDTAAQALLGFENVKFAGALKEMMRSLLRYVGVDEGTIERMIEGDLKEAPSEHLCGKTPRYAMQTLGTEWGRVLIGETIWTDAFESRCDLFDSVKCTDLRFPNEGEVIKKLGGRRIRIVDPDKKPEPGEHPSEALIDTLEVDAEIVNDKETMDVADLHDKVLATVFSNAMDARIG